MGAEVINSAHPTHRYAIDVVEGRVVVGKLVRLACQRHLEDLRNGHERGLWFDEKSAGVGLRFFGLLRFSKGRWGGLPFVVESWQAFLIGSLFGWKRGEYRRYREAHLEVARKNGKTETAAGVALKLLAADGEPGAEVYCLATKRDQAKLTFDVAKKLAAASPALKKRLRRMKAEIRDERSGSKIEPLGADADSLDGLNVHGAIKDELHAWKARDLWDVIDTATGARSQYLGVSTTTAGYNRRSIWWERRELCIALLEGKAGFQNDELFPLIYTLDDEDDWEKPEHWLKANPNLNVTVQLEELSRRAAEAKQTPGQVNAFRRLRLNQPTETATKWLNMALWRAAADGMTESALAGRACYGGLDLSQTTDLTAWALVFPPIDDDPVYRLLVRHWLPKEGLYERETRDRAPYQRWADGRRLTLSEGDWVDYALIRRRIFEDSHRFRLLGLAYDRQFAPSIIQQVMAGGIECHPIGQGFYGLNTGTKEFNKLILSRELKHEGCPLLEWEAENTAVEEDAAGNLKPSKRKSTQRIDGIAASVNALGLAIAKDGRDAEPGILEIDFDTFNPF